MDKKDNKKYKNKKTFFGYTKVALSKKIKMVENVFNTVSYKYDLMNDILSFGLHRFWKWITIQYSGVLPGYKVLDLAGGTGDITVHLSPLVGETGKVFLTDINISMLNKGREKLHNLGIIGNVNYVQADAENLPFLDNYFDCVIISFGLRNITNKKDALISMYRVLKKGGRLLVLDFSKPTFKYNFLFKMYNFYSFKIIPNIGKIIVNDSKSYRYLVESIRMHPDQKTLLNLIKGVGFKHSEYINITGGIVALHRGYKY